MWTGKERDERRREGGEGKKAGGEEDGVSQEASSSIIPHNTSRHNTPPQNFADTHHSTSPHLVTLYQFAAHTALTPWQLQHFVRQQDSTTTVQYITTHYSITIGNQILLVIRAPGLYAKFCQETNSSFV